MQRIAETACIWFLLLTAVSVANAQKNRVAGPNQISYSNRIEYHDFGWQAFHKKAFNIYFPKGADSLPAAIVSEVLEANALIAMRMSNSAIPKAIIIYPSLQAQYESSIGIREAIPLTIPSFLARGSRIVLHYQGSYEDLLNQLYLAIARATWEGELERNTSIGAQVRGAYKSNPVPYWYKEGAIRYFAFGWPLQSEESLRRAFDADSVSSFCSMVESRPELAGAAFCYYLSSEIRPDAPLQVYYQLRKGKSLARALRLVCKQDIESVYVACVSWYQKRFQAFSGAQKDAETRNQIWNTSTAGKAVQHESKSVQFRIPFKASAAGTILDYQLNPSANKIALTVSFPDHTRCVYLCDLSGSSGHTKVATYYLPPWLKNHNADKYPLLNWSPNSSELLVSYPEKGMPTVYRFSSEGSPVGKTPLPFIDGLSSLIPLVSNQYLLSAWVQGQSDLVVFDAKTNKYTPLTNDAADDANPILKSESSTVLGNSKGTVSPAAVGDIYFTSARAGDTAYGQDSLSMRHGIYMLSGRKIKPVLTDTTSYTTYSEPVVIDAQHLLLTATVRGWSRIVLLDLSQAEGCRSARSKSPSETVSALQILSDNAATFQYLPQSRSIAFFKRAGDSILITSKPFDTWIKEASALGRNNDSSVGPWLLDYQKRIAAQQKEDSLLQAARAAGGPSFLDGMSAKASSDKKGKKETNSDSSEFQYHPSKASPYLLQLYSAYFSTQVNNDYFINRYQPYGTFQGSYKFPDIGGMVQGALSDLFEHHHLSIAYRLPAGSEGSMFFTKYSNTAKRLDWSLAYYRNVESIRPDPYRAWVDADGRRYPGAAKVKTHYYELGLQYPVSYHLSTGASLFVRKDRTVFLATDLYSLTFPALTDLWTGVSLWTETQHLKPTLTGLYRGWQGRVGCDAFKGFVGDESAVGALSISAQWHKPLYRYITLVAKVQAGLSGGNRKVLYNLGGVDNNLTPRIDTTIHFSQNAPYAFQTLVTPLRGYQQNSLYGSRYCLMNADVYFPLLETLIPLETNFPSLNRLQVGLFSDVAAVGGDSRYRNSAGGWLVSYGFSARTILAGYPLRFDIAWPGSFSRKPVWYLSLSLQ